MNSNQVIIRSDIDKMLFALLGRWELVETWWAGPNIAFDFNTPNDVYYSGEPGRKRVYQYVSSHCDSGGS